MYQTSSLPHSLHLNLGFSTLVDFQGEKSPSDSNIGPVCIFTPPSPVRVLP